MAKRHGALSSTRKIKHPRKTKKRLATKAATLKKRAAKRK